MDFIKSIINFLVCVTLILIDLNFQIILTAAAVYINFSH